MARLQAEQFVRPLGGSGKPWRPLGRGETDAAGPLRKMTLKSKED